MVIDVTRSEAALGAAPDQLTAEESRELMLDFCSMGRNCEFGAAQRAFHAEPLDLLRWAFTTKAVLIKLLRNRFEGIGDPSKIEVRKQYTEAMVFHTGYDFVWHSWSKESFEAIHAREVKRLPFLARKMMEDLTEGRRIFVFRSGADRTAEDAAQIIEAMRSYGRPTLLYVTEGAPLSVTSEGNGLLRATIPKFGDTADVLASTPANDWLELCRSARVMPPDA